MIYKFKVLSEEDDKFFMDIELKSDQTFYEFHEFIQDELEYDRSHLATFFIANHNWQKKLEIPLIEMDNGSKSKIVTMDKALLKDYIIDAHQKLIYLFDFLNERSFFIELMETKQESANMYYPVCTDFGGEIPLQFSKKSTKKSNIFEDENQDDDIFSIKKNKPVIDEDFDEDFAHESFDKDIQFDMDDDDLLRDDVHDDEPEDEQPGAKEEPEEE